MSSGSPNPYPVVYDAPSGALQYVFQSGQVTIPEASVNAITALTGDVTASGPGSAAATISAGAVTTSKIAALNITAALIAAGAVTPAKISTTTTDDFVFPRDVTAMRNLIVSGSTLSIAPSGAVNATLNVGSSSASVAQVILRAGAGNQAFITFNQSGDKWDLLAQSDGTFLIYDLVNNKALATFTPNIGISVPAFKLPTTPTAGYVLTSDASGNGTWQVASGGGSVASVSLTNQGADISPTAFYTPSVSGIYHVAVYGYATTSDPGAGSSTPVTISYTDANFSNANQVSAINLTSAGPNFVQPNGVDIYLAAGQPVSYDVTGGGPYGAARYSLYISVTKG